MRGQRQPGTRAGAALAGVLLLAGCAAGAARSTHDAAPSASGSPPATAAASAPAASPAASPDPTPGPTVTVAPTDPAPNSTDVATPPPIPAEPPAAVLGGLEGAAVAGRLGSYTWGSFGSDAPWIVGKVLGSSRAGAPLDVSVGEAPGASWTAEWAEVSSGFAGNPTGGASGTGPATFTAPATPGDWSLAVTVTFAPAHSATYFWRLTVRE